MQPHPAICAIVTPGIMPLHAHSEHRLPLGSGHPQPRLLGGRNLEVAHKLSRWLPHCVLVHNHPVQRRVGVQARLPVRWRRQKLIWLAAGGWVPS